MRMKKLGIFALILCFAILFLGNVNAAQNIYVTCQDEGLYVVVENTYGDEFYFYDYCDYNTYVDYSCDLNARRTTITECVNTYSEFGANYCKDRDVYHSRDENIVQCSDASGCTTTYTFTNELIVDICVDNEVCLSGNCVCNYESCAGTCCAIGQTCYNNEYCYLGPVPTGKCEIRARENCLVNNVVMGLSSATNAHGELGSQSNYDSVLCCGFTGTDVCSGTNKIIGLSSATNAHAEVSEVGITGECINDNYACFEYLNEGECPTATCLWEGRYLSERCNPRAGIEWTECLFSDEATCRSHLGCKWYMPYVERCWDKVEKDSYCFEFNSAETCPSGVCNWRETSVISYDYDVCYGNLKCISGTEFLNVLFGFCANEKASCSGFSIGTCLSHGDKGCYWKDYSMVGCYDSELIGQEGYYDGGYCSTLAKSECRAHFYNGQKYLCQWGIYRPIPSSCVGTYTISDTLCYEFTENTCFGQEGCFWETRANIIDGCPPDYPIEMLSLSSEKNAHIGGFGHYDVKVCCGEPDPDEVCYLTSASWSKSSAFNKEKVFLNVQGTNCDETPLSFELWESDSVNDDLVPSSISASFIGNSAQGTWITHWTYEGDDDWWSDPRDYYFIAKVVGGTEEERSNLLSVSKEMSCEGAGGDYCSFDPCPSYYFSEGDDYCSMQTAGKNPNCCGCPSGTAWDGTVCRERCDTDLGMCALQDSKPLYSHLFPDEYCDPDEKCYYCDETYVVFGSSCLKDTCREMGGVYCGEFFAHADDLGPHCGAAESVRCWNCSVGFEFYDNACVVECLDTEWRSEGHCCLDGSAWKYDEDFGWDCYGSDDCSLGLIDCLRGKTFLGKFSCFGLSPCASGEVCCEQNYGVLTPDCVLPEECIEGY